MSRPSMSTITPLSSIITAPINTKSLRSYSTSSTASTTSSISTNVSNASSPISTINSNSNSNYSRAPGDLLDRLASQESNTTVHLWSAGNIRLNGRDLTVPSKSMLELVQAMWDDERFEFVELVHLNEDRDDWKICYRRTDAPGSTIITPSTSDVD